MQISCQINNLPSRREELLAAGRSHTERQPSSRRINCSFPILLDSGSKKRVTSLEQVVIFCASHKYRLGVDCKMRTTQKCQIFQDKQVKILHPYKDKQENALDQPNTSRHRESSNALVHSSAIVNSGNFSCRRFLNCLSSWRTSQIKTNALA